MVGVWVGRGVIVFASVEVNVTVGEKVFVGEVVMV